MLPFIEPGNTNDYAKNTIRSGKRIEIQDVFRQEGIPTTIHHSMLLPRQPAMQVDSNNLLVTNVITTRVMRLPLHPYLTEEQQDFIVSRIS
jgi:UDP-2-acetamido-2-deoxy-ribo-hexuluronate aminotransferase